jgi:outer membrane receptor for ferrienterochelin and colicins
MVYKGIDMTTLKYPLHPLMMSTVFLCVITWLPSQAWAEEDADIIQQVLNPQQSQIEIEHVEGDGPLSIEEIVNPPVFSASNTKENALIAPAWVIIITGEEMRQRGYIELSQIFDDLPSIDIARVYGPTWFRTYWRGRRSGSWGDNFLFMIDNIPWHDHIYDNARMMIPISYIERVEIVYGPGSLIHGSNAMMGSINVVTKSDSQQLGSQVGIVTGVHAPQSMIDKIKRLRYLTDFSLFHKSDDFRLAITGRIDQGYLDEGLSDFDKYKYWWTQDKHYADSDIWGTTLTEDFTNLSGEFRSPFRNLSLDARILTDEVEVGFQYFDFQRGTGLQLLWRSF